MDTVWFLPGPPDFEVDALQPGQLRSSASGPLRQLARVWPEQRGQIALLLPPLSDPLPGVRACVRGASPGDRGLPLPAALRSSGGATGF